MDSREGRPRKYQASDEPSFRMRVAMLVSLPAVMELGRVTGLRLP